MTIRGEMPTVKCDSSDNNRLEGNFYVLPAESLSQEASYYSRRDPPLARARAISITGKREDRRAEP
jgi:hypothetical protein